MNAYSFLFDVSSNINCWAKWSYESRESPYQKSFPWKLSHITRNADTNVVIYYMLIFLM